MKLYCNIFRISIEVEFSQFWVLAKNKLWLLSLSCTIKSYYVVVKWSKNVFNNILRVDNTSLSRRVQFENRCSIYILYTAYLFGTYGETARIVFRRRLTDTGGWLIFFLIFCWQREPFFFLFTNSNFLRGIGPRPASVATVQYYNSGDGNAHSNCCCLYEL